MSLLGREISCGSSKVGMKFVFWGSIVGSNIETLCIPFDYDMKWTTFTFDEE
jgi:hypothetical protein